jgi:hypothetical protein
MTGQLVVLRSGDRVAYARGWLQSIGALTGELPFLRGRVCGIEHLMSGTRIANVVWDQGGAARCNVRNLVREDLLHLEEA